MLEPRVFLPNRSHFTLPKFDLNPLRWFREMIRSKHIKEKRTRGELNYWINLGFDSFMGKVKRRSSLQSKQRIRESAKYLPLHSHNHNRGKEYTLNQIFFSFSWIISFWVLLSVWVNESAVTSATPLNPSMSGLKEALSLYFSMQSFMFETWSEIFTNHID